MWRTGGPQTSSREKQERKTASPSRDWTNTSTSQQPLGAETSRSILLDSLAPSKQHRSLYPASIVGLAITARSEMGYLIASCGGKGRIIRTT